LFAALARSNNDHLQDLNSAFSAIQDGANVRLNRKANLTYRHTMEADMSKKTRKSRNDRRISVRPAVEQIRAVAEIMNASRSRFAGHAFLSVVYEHYWKWSDDGHTDERIKAAIRRSSDRRHNNAEHPVKMLIRAADCSPEAKVLSRWVRALEYASMKRTRPQHLTYIFERHGGIAGCARLAAKFEPKRTPPPDRDDWAEDAPVRHVPED
jgi:hypothetical protein